MKRTDDEARDFVVSHTAMARAPLVPEIALYLATESTPLWHATQAWLEKADVAPPFWAFAWAGGQALARTLLDRPEWVRGRAVLDFGCGGGLVAIAACRAGASRVVAIDRDPLALVACALNARANRVDVATSRRDALENGDVLGIDVVLAGDVFYDREDAPPITAALTDIARSGVVVLAGCPGRAYTPSSSTITVASELEVPDALELEGKASVLTKVLRF